MISTDNSQKKMYKRPKSTEKMFITKRSTQINTEG